MQANNDILVRKAVLSDAMEVVNIMDRNFDPEDDQRIMGTKVTTALFKMLFQLEDSFVLVAEKEKKILGYMWLQLEPLSIFKCFQNAPSLMLGVMFEVIKDFKLRLTFQLLLKQEKKDSLSIPFPIIKSIAVNRVAGIKGIGSMLVMKGQECLAAKGIREYFVLTSINNLNAISFYNNNGFKKYQSNKVSVIFRKRMGSNKRRV